MGGVKLSKAAAVRTRQVVRLVERRNLSDATRGRFPRFPRGGGGGGQGEVVQGLLVKSMAPTTVNGVAGTLTPSAVVESSVIVLVEPDEPTGAMTGETDDDDELILYDAVNRAWLRELTAGDGAEQLDEEDEPTGVYNATPKLVYGFKSTYTATVGEGEEATEEQRDLFVITDVQNPPRIYHGLTTAAVTAGADWTMDGVNLLWGDPLPSGQNQITAVNNPDDWDGPDNGLALGIEKPNGTNQGLDLECPE